MSDQNPPAAYTPADWFWHVDGDTTRAFSSALLAAGAPFNQSYVEVWDAARLTRIDSVEGLVEVLIAAGLLKRILFKADVWRRATDEEAEIIDATLAAAPVRLRRLWADSREFDTLADDFALIRAPMVKAFGDDRAAVLLAPSA